MTAGVVGVYGASGCGRGVLPLLRSSLSRAGDNRQLVFIDDALAGQTINGHPVVAFTEFASRSSASLHVSLAVANPAVRRRLAEQCDKAGVKFLDARADNVVQLDDVEIGEGAILSPFVTLTSNIRIGRHFQAKLYAYVEPDCVIGDFVTFAPGAMCNGNVVIEDGAYVGSGAVIKQGKPGEPLIIGRDASVGMGAVVIRSVPPGAVVVGNPARPIRASTHLR